MWGIVENCGVFCPISMNVRGSSGALWGEIINH